MESKTRLIKEVWVMLCEMVKKVVKVKSLGAKKERSVETKNTQEWVVPLLHSMAERDGPIIQIRSVSNLAVCRLLPRIPRFAVVMTELQVSLHSLRLLHLCSQKGRRLVDQQVAAKKGVELQIVKKALTSLEIEIPTH